MELETLSPKTHRLPLVDVKESNCRRFVKIMRTLTRVFKKRIVSQTTRQSIIIQAAEMESRYNEEVKLRKEAEEALAREKEEVEKMKGLLLECYKEEQDKLHLQARVLEQKHHEEKLHLRKETESLLAIERERLEKVKLQLVTLKNEHENMCIKAEEFESMYEGELILRKSIGNHLLQELEIVQGLVESCRIDANAMREDRDNDLKLVHEITTKQMESFICPISQEVMKDPHLAADGYTYEAEAIKRWLNTGHDTSPMTNLKLSHPDLVPNRALRSAIQELV